MKKVSKSIGQFNEKKDLLRVFKNPQRCVNLSSNTTLVVMRTAVFQNDRKHVGRNLIQTLAAIFIL